VGGQLLLAAIYFGAAKLGLALAFQAEQVTAVWPPTGIALSAVLLFGYRSTAGVALGAFLANLTTPNETWLTAAGIALGNTLEAVAAVWLLRRFIHFRPALDRLADVLGLVGLAAALSTMVSATIGVTTLAVTGVHSWSAFPALWWLWWLGDSAGAILIAPVILTLAASWPWPRPSRLRLLEATALSVTLAVTLLVVFAGIVPPGGLTGLHSTVPGLEFTVFPLVVWAALRFGQPGSTLLTAVASGFAVWGTVHGFGPFVGGTPHENLIHLQAYMAIVAVTALLLSAAVAERRTTELAASQRAEELETLMDVLPVAVWIARDPQCRQISGNRAGHQLLRVPVGQNLSKSAPGPDRPAGFKIYHQGREVPSEELPMQIAAGQGMLVRDFLEDIVFSDGSVASAFGSAAPLFDDLGQVRGCIAAFMDVSELKRLEKELHEKIQELAAVDRRKNIFLATLAHELRNPLAPIRNALHILRLSGDDPQVREKTLVLMERQLSHMVRLIDDLLDIARISRDKLPLRRENTDLHAAISSAVEAVRHLIDEAGQSLDLSFPPEPVRLDADPVRLAQVFTNLLANAAKYTDPGGQIRVMVERGAGDVFIKVRDNGRGIAPEELPFLFEMFSQAAPALERPHGGLGIGLSLVRRLVDMHGGTVHAKSDGLGRGSEFIVRLPALAEPSALMPGTTDSSSPEGPHLRILVVDDNRDAAESLGELLTLLGHHVRTAHDGEAALQEANAFRPNAVLLDIGLPRLNGYEVCKSIRGEPWSTDCLLIAISGWGQEADKLRAAQSGFDHHLTKPVEIDMLLRLLALQTDRRSGSGAREAGEAASSFPPALK
jgi:signal transduction histidine kinase/ActR/RegA family two-component response regulator